MPNRKTCWIYKYMDEDPYAGWSNVHLNWETAIKAAAEHVAELATSELERFEYEEGDPHPELLREVISFVKAGSYEKAYDAWQDYASDVSAETTVELEEVDLIED